MFPKIWAGISTLRVRFLYSEPEVVTQRDTEGEITEFHREIFRTSLRVSVEALCNSVFLFGSGSSRLGEENG